MIQIHCVLGTTLGDDQKIAKRLSSWDTDANIPQPSLSTLAPMLADQVIADSVVRFQANVFKNCQGFEGAAAKCNIDPAVERALFATLLVGIESDIDLNPNSAYAKAVTEAASQAGCEISTIFALGRTLRTSIAPIPTNNKCSNCDIERALARLTLAVDGLDRKLDAGLRAAPSTPANQGPTLSTASVTVDLRGFNTTIESFVYMWYIDQPWKFYKSGTGSAKAKKPTQTLFSDMKVRLAWLKVVSSMPMHVPPRPAEIDVTGYSTWKTRIFELASQMATRFNERMTLLDGKGPTRKASSITTRVVSYTKVNSSGMVTLIAQASRRVKSGQIVDNVTPSEHDGLAKLIENVVFAEDIDI